MESDTIVAEKPANKAVRAATERVEPRPVTNGNACGQSTGGHYADQTQCWRPPCHRRPHGYGEPLTCRQRPEVGAVCANGTYGSVRGAPGNRRPYRESVIAFSYALWEDQYRGRIAHECKLANKNKIKSDVFYDLNKYRQAILHSGGRLAAEPKVIRFFNRGEEVLLTDDHMYELFSLLVGELNRLGREYYRQDPQFSLDRPLNG